MRFRRALIKMDERNKQERIVQITSEKNAKMMKKKREAAFKVHKKEFKNEQKQGKYE